MMSRTTNITLALSLFAAAVFTVGLTNFAAAQQPVAVRPNAQSDEVRVLYKSAKVGALDIFLTAWGKNDQIFPPAGAEPYRRDLKTLEYHLIDAGHFALETDGETIAKLMRKFLGKHVARN